MTTIEIDYSRHGRSQRITVPLFRRERVVEVGERVRVVGDDVPERTAQSPLCSRVAAKRCSSSRTAPDRTSEPVAP
ncbi:MAG: hypothetical protein U5R31_03865 [Acidimicrobiia bacterium]|nr:hypothetical protein [Acidimicrobiia bacterium]